MACWKRCIAKVHRWSVVVYVAHKNRDKRQNNSGIYTQNNMIKVQIIHETKNDNWMGLIEGESDIIQILEDGMVDADQIVAISQLFENTQLYMQGGHIILIEENYYTFVVKWMQSTQTTTSKAK